MLAKIKPHTMGGVIKAIPSKSYAHRIMLCAMLSNMQTQIVGNYESKDMEATLSCIKALGCKVNIQNGVLYLSKEKKMQDEIVLDCIESGSTVRFILPIVAALGVEAKVIGKEGLQKRPLKDLIDVLKEHGEYIDSDFLPIVMKGKIKPGEYRIRGDVSSQYITGLLLALPILEGDSEIVIEGELVSKKYIDITLDVQKEFGIQIEQTNSGFKVKGNQKYIAPKKIVVQGDWSNAAFWLSLGAINNDIEISGLSLDTQQGDREILQILMGMGAKVQIINDVISVKKSKLNATTIDMQNIPDLAPIVSILMASAECISVMKNVDRLRIKETDRLAAIIETLQKMGVKCRYQNNELSILGGDKLCAFSNGAYNDHRMVMTQAIAASVAKGECVIEGVEAKDKSYPSFFVDYKALGGDVYVK